MKFQVPYKSPGNHVKEWVQQTCRGQKTPQNQIVVRTPKAPKKIKPNKREKPGTPKTPTFKLYGIKSPCRRRIILDGSSRFSFKSPKSQNICSQSTTPGITPAKFIANFEARIGNAPLRVSNGGKSMVVPDECLPDSTLTDGAQIIETRDQFDEAQELQEDGVSECGGSSHWSHYCGVYDLPISPESQQRTRNRDKARKKQAKAKEYVLKVLRQTRAELQELRRKHRAILLQLEAVQPAASSQPRAMAQRNNSLSTGIDRGSSPTEQTYSTRRNSAKRYGSSEKQKFTEKQNERPKRHGFRFNPINQGAKSSAPTEE